MEGSEFVGWSSEIQAKSSPIPLQMSKSAYIRKTSRYRKNNSETLIVSYSVYVGVIGLQGDLSPGASPHSTLRYAGVHQNWPIL